MPMRWLLAFLVTAVLSAAGAPKIHYSKDFPGSTPAHVTIWVDNSGKGEFNDSPGEQPPIQLQLEPSETEAIFSLAEKLGRFSRPLESELKVAFMGMKTFRYENGPASSEVKFNYSQDLDARLLLEWFERIGETEYHFINLERTARFDRLGVDRALLELQITAERNRLVGARQLLPILDRIAKNQSLFNRARERAAAIAEAIRAGTVKTE
jgi:hypothetical protein